ncbi:MAG: tetratricopeptide repeat protein [Gemmatimonadota bacterium]|nr:MAG: tetratricopeptide repeat protein [Gemmatimonadota bacterium]
MRIYLLRAGVAVLVLGLFTGGTAIAQVQELASGKIPITTASVEARNLFLQGQNLTDRIRATDARQYYLQAVELDPGFAYAWWALAVAAPTAREFFESLEHALASVDNASDAERMLILATDAAVRGDPAAQREQLTQLVEAYPGDERAHVALGNFYYGRQEWESAIEQYTMATEINPDFSPPYNTMGYANRFLGDYDEAERAFERYIKLIPDEPNPYDSYAELLMKMGRFEESIANYEKALTHDANFVASYVGIGNNQMFMGRGDDARATFRKLSEEIARTDGERRAGLLWTAVSYLHEADYEAAIEQVRAMYKIAEENGDGAQMSGDLNLIADILLHSGDPQQALTEFQRSVETMEGADVPDEVKEATRRNHLYDAVRVALMSDDLATARTETEAYGEQVRMHNIPFEVRQHHELLGMIALHEEDYETAIAEFAQANRQDPQVLLMSAKAHQNAGHDEEARALLEQAANFNQLNFNYAYVRAKAQKMLSEM